MYFIPLAEHQIETSVKKSRFIATAFYADTRAQALQGVDKARQQFPDARHHCWAYLIGSPHHPAGAAMSDDGEPAGTAGKPILNVLQHKEVGNIVIVVSRYFGGIKLGAGGLIRAYSTAAQSVMDTLTVTRFIARVRVDLTVEFSQEHDLRHWLSIHQGEVIDVHYTQRVNCKIELAESEKESLLLTATERGWQVNQN